MSDWKTRSWYETRENLVQRIRSNPELDVLDQRIVEDLTALLLPYDKGGEYMKALYPGIYAERWYGVEATAKETYRKDRGTLRQRLDKLVGAGAIMRRYGEDDTTHRELVYLTAMPLLTHSERITFAKFLPDPVEKPSYIKRRSMTSIQFGDPLTLHLERRLESGIFIKAQWKPGRAKYLHWYGPVSIEKHLQRTAWQKAHIYGSATLLQDGAAYQVEYDFDDTQPWLDTHHRAIQQQLALGGFASIYAKRRPGRGHLIIQFSSPVDPEAAYQAIVQAAPALATCKEVYPVGGKRNGRISWPFFYLVEQTVRECAMVAYYPECPGLPIESKGARSDRDTTALIFATAINDAAIALAPASDVPVVAEEIISSDHLPPVQIAAPDKAAIAAFNSSHTVTAILGMEVGDRFISPWRPREETPSAVIVNDHWVVDYGNAHSDKPPVCHDAYDCYVAVNHVDKSAALERLIGEDATA